MKTILRGEFIALSTYIRKEKDLTLIIFTYEIRRKDQFNPKASRRKWILKNSAKINENKKTIERINETK